MRRVRPTSGRERRAVECKQRLAHAGFSVASLLLGVGVFRLAKGTELHRVVGVAYVLSLFAVNVTALTIYRIFGRFGVFHALSVVNLAILLAGAI